MYCIKAFDKCTRKTKWTKIGTFQGIDYGPNFILVGVDVFTAVISLKLIKDRRIVEWTSLPDSWSLGCPRV